jgi:uncharacterized membrane protein
MTFSFDISAFIFTNEKSEEQHMKYSKERERKYYNRELVRGSIRDEVTKLGDDVDNGTYEFPWKNFIISTTGTILGLILRDMIGTETLIPNKGLKFCADVVILVVMISLVNLVVIGFSKLLKPKAN